MSVPANYYAAKLAIQKASKDNRTFIDELLSLLEKQRKEIGENEAITSDLVGYAHVENFAIKIFSKADDEDRAGQGSQKTAKNYVAAANFLELLKVFGEIDSEVEEKIKYAKWRAAEIVKATREGRQPTPPPGTNQQTDGASLREGITLDEMAQSLDATLGATSPPTQNTLLPGFQPFPNSQPTSVGPATNVPSITQFPSPPLAPSNPGGGSVYNPMAPSPNPNTWGAPSGSPNMGQYNPTDFQPIQQPPPVSAFVQPTVSSPGPGSGNQPMQAPYSNPGLQPMDMGTTLPAAGGYGYGGNIYQPSPSVPSPAPVMPAVSPVQPVPLPYAQPAAFNSPSAPYQQPAQPMAYSPAPPPMVMDPAVSAQVQKHCKWTVSALTYDDVPTAIDNLEKALALLR
ncbi:hypothetical protein BGW38_008422, partial [Lunasporangiospora selenospora]